MDILSCILTFAAVALASVSIGGAWDSVTRKYIADLAPMLDALSMDRAKLPGYLRIWGAMLVGSFVLVAFILVMPPLSIAAAGLVYVAPRLILMAMIERRRQLLRDQMVGASVALANTCRAGLSLAQGIETVAAETQNPLASEFRRIVSEYKHGRPLTEALTHAKERLDVDSFTLFSAAVLVCVERGGKITEALERISHSLQENQRVERKLESQTAGGKKLVWILTAFPFFFLLAFYFLHPEGTIAVFRSLIGQLILLVIIGLTCFSLWWSKKILDIEL